MKSLLAALMVLIVSGDNKVTITVTDTEDRVLLPCSCGNPHEKFRWQLEPPKEAKVYDTTSGFTGTYKGRAKIFLTEDNYNCSLLLTNITVHDQGKYRCSFKYNDQYKRSFVHLNISAHYDVCQTPATDLNHNEFQCDVKGRYRDPEIQWYMDGQLLTNSSITNITLTYTLDAHTGLYSFKSKIITELNGASQPICEVKTKGISTIISKSCMSKTVQIKTNVIPECFKLYKVIPIVLVIGVSVILLYRWKLSKRT